MPRRPPLSRRWLTAASWPVGVTLTAWDYMWRTTVMRRLQRVDEQPAAHLPPDPYPAAVDASELQTIEDGVGPLFHRRYRARIRDSELAPEQLMQTLSRDLNAAAPTFARFQRVLGDGGALAVGDEYVVRMPGPWDGPVRVIAQTPRSFRLATLAGHLEAGQIDFRAATGDHGEPDLQFTIESWARSGDRLSNLLYHRVGMAKEIQLHMWISFLEGVTALAGGELRDGIEIETIRVDVGEHG